MKNITILIRDGRGKVKDWGSNLDINLKLSRFNTKNLLFIVIQGIFSIEKVIILGQFDLLIWLFCKNVSYSTFLYLII